MLYRMILPLLMIVHVGQVHAEESALPELREGQVYVRAQGPADCASQVRPRLSAGEGGGAAVLQFGGSGYEWANANAEPMDDGECTITSIQRLESVSGGVRLTVDNIETCRSGKDLVGSQREIVTVLSGRIEQKYIYLAHDRSGRLVEDPKRPAFTCAWQVR